MRMQVKQLKKQQDKLAKSLKFFKIQTSFLWLTEQMPIYSIKAGVTRLKAAEQVNKWTICQAGHSTLLVLLKKNERKWEREKQKKKGAQKGPCFTYKKTRSSQASVTEKQWKWVNTGVSGVITKSKGVFSLITL